MSDYRQYRRTAIAEMADWHPGFDMEGVSVSAPDAAAGSPKEGDKIARNPVNYEDRWLVAAAYFAENFEPLAETPIERWIPYPELLELYEGTRHALEEAQATIARQAALIAVFRDKTVYYDGINVHGERVWRCRFCQRRNIHYREFTHYPGCPMSLAVAAATSA